MPNNLPETMKALEITEYSGESSSFRFIEKQVPKLKEGQALIKIHACSINPSDLMFLRGLYGIKKKLPVVPGFEGSGTVVGLGSATSSLKLGDRVACVAGYMGDGTFAEYMATDISNCIPLLDSVSLEEGAMFFVNPLTSYALLELAKSKNSTGVVQTASGSALGKMIIRLAKGRNLPLLNIVRREDQIEQVKAEGAEYVLNSSSANFDKEFIKLSRKLKINYFIDAVGGEVATKIFHLSPAETNMVSYGNLSEEALNLQPGVFIFQKKTIEGFWLSFWINSLSPEVFSAHSKEAQLLLKSYFKSDVNKRFKLESGFEAIEYYKNNMSAGKILIKPED
jgi:NADPH:quinone reductase